MRFAALVGWAGVAVMGCAEPGLFTPDSRPEPSPSVGTASLILDSETRLTGSGASNFGDVVAISGNRAIIGARLDGSAGSNSGAAYVYEFDGVIWNQVVKLTASDAAAFDDFGWAVDIDGDVAVVGVPGADDASECVFQTCDSGAAYVFRYDGAAWVQEAKLTASDARFLDLFGRAVSVSGDVVVVGAFADDNACPDDHTNCNSGAAYAFAWTGGAWVEEAKLVPTDAARGKRFGFAVAQHGDWAVIGAPAGNAEGSAYAFQRTGTGWIERQKFAAPLPDVSNFFGEDVAVDGVRVIVGAFDVGSNTGAVYVYGSDGASWTLETTLTASNAAAGAYFGRAVSVQGDLVLVGAPSVDGAQIRFGAVYLYQFDGTDWKECAFMMRPSGQAGEEFGRSLDIEGNVAVIGTWFRGAFAYQLTFSPDEVLQDLITQVIEFEFIKGIEMGLTAKLNAVLASIDADRPAAVAQLNAFISQVDALRGVHVTDAEADQLIAVATGIIASLQAAS